MKKALLWLAFVLFNITSFSQILTCTPNFPVESTTPLEIIMDGSKGNTGLNFYTPTNEFFVHTGVITKLSTSSGNANAARKQVAPGGKDDQQTGIFLTLIY